MKSFIILTLAFLTALSSARKEPLTVTPIRVTSGIFLRPTSSRTVVYQQSIPIIFNVKFALSNRQKITANMPQYCSTPDGLVAPLCQIVPSIYADFSRLDSLMETVRDNMLGITSSLVKLPKTTTAAPISSEEDISAESDERGNDINRRNRRNAWYDFTGSFYHWCCDLATRTDLGPLIDSNNNISAVVNTLRDALENEHKNVISLSQHSYQYLIGNNIIIYYYYYLFTAFTAIGPCNYIHFNLS